MFFARCGKPSGSSEHVWPAALGGRLEDSRILCDDCQEHLGKTLDKALSRDLRHFNTINGVESRHRRAVIPAPVTDQQTGQRFLLDEDHGIVHAEPALVRAGIDHAGLEEREYKNIGPIDEKAFLARLKATEGKTFAVVQRLPPRPILVARPFHGDTSFGGDETFRAVARIALNFLAAKAPAAMARAPGLEPLKRWIWNGEAESEFAHFAEPLPDGVLPQNTFEMGHRVALGFCASTNTVSARLTLFDCHEIALKLGSVECPNSHLIIIDVDPRAERSGPGYDMREFCPLAGPEPAALGEFARDAATVLARNQTQSARLLAASYASAWQARLPPIVDALNATRGTLLFQQNQAIRRILSGQLQTAFNLLAIAMRRASQQLDGAGYPDHAAFFQSLVEAEAGDVVVSDLGALLTQQVLFALASAVLEALADGPITFDMLLSILDGERGWRIAYRVIVDAYEMLGPLGISGAEPRSGVP